jgi:hypothetical protein
MQHEPLSAGVIARMRQTSPPVNGAFKHFATEAMDEVHGAGALIVMPMMLAMAHPHVRTGDLERPGALMTGFGSMTPVGSVAAHVVFGLVVGSIYAGIVL